MRRILKKQEPPTLLTHRLSTPDADWDGYSDKRTAQDLLCREQHALCCFCQRPIKPDVQPPNGRLKRNMKVAHLVPKKSPTGKKNPELQVTWSNLFGVCMGGEGKLPRDQWHCDTKQQDTELKKLNLLQLRQDEVRFLANGELSSNDPDIHEDLTKTLNLNAKTLVDARVTAGVALINIMEDKKQGHWDAAFIERHISEIEAQRPLEPYCDFLLFILRQQLRRR